MGLNVRFQGLSAPVSGRDEFGNILNLRNRKTGSIHAQKHSGETRCGFRFDPTSAWSRFVPDSGRVTCEQCRRRSGSANGDDMLEQLRHHNNEEQWPERCFTCQQPAAWRLGFDDWRTSPGYAGDEFLCDACLREEYSETDIAAVLDD